MHPNAEISYWQQRTNQIFTTIQNIQEIPVIIKKVKSRDKQGEQGDPDQEIEHQDNKEEGGAAEQQEVMSTA
jgi:hypothetical protein